MTGALTCPLHNGLRMVAQPTQETVSMIGVAYCTLSDKFQIQNLEVYFDQNEPMSSMVKNNNSPLGLPAKGKTAGGVDVQLKAAPSQAKPGLERQKLTARDSSSNNISDVNKSVQKAQVEKQHLEPEEGASPNTASPGRGVLGSLWNMLGSGS